MEKSAAVSTLSFTSLALALAQSICTAVITISAVRVAIGLTALAAGSIYLPVKEFHQDAFRIPMLTIAAAGALLNLAVLGWIWYLRARPSAQWRRRALDAKQKRSEKLQVLLALVTLLLVGIEVYLHHTMSRPAAHTIAAISSGVEHPVRVPDPDERATAH